MSRPTCVCAWCGAEPLGERVSGPGRPPLYCSARCSNSARHYRQRGRIVWGEFPRLGIERPVRVCDWCGESFRARRDKRNHEGLQRYCSNECRHESGHGKWVSPDERDESLMVAMYGRMARLLRRRLYALERTKACEWCGDPFTGASGRSRFCSKRCKGLALAHLVAAIHARRRDPSGPLTCLVCAARFAGHSSSLYCSPRCTKKACGRYQSRARRRWNSRLRRMRPMVLARHGWYCALCDRPIDWTLHWSDPLALSIDHVIPLALGGTDDLDNLQPAHRECNVLKGAAA